MDRKKIEAIEKYARSSFEAGYKQAEQDFLKMIDYCIGYNQFNSIGEMSRMIEVKELKSRIQKQEKTE
jgi:hypothetical protein